MSRLLDRVLRRAPSRWRSTRLWRLLATCRRGAAAAWVAIRYRKDARIAIPHLEVHITHHCNLSCEGCLHFTNHGHAETLSVDALKRSMALWKDRVAPKTFALLGGEPTLHKDLVEIVYLAREMWPAPKTRLELVTNGLLLHMHPGLPRALADTHTLLCISAHGDGTTAPKYMEKLGRALALADDWVRDYGIQVQRERGIVFNRGYKGIGDRMMPFEDGDPVRSFEQCVTGQTCFQLFEDSIWKCPMVAYLRLQDRKFDLSDKWDPYLRYEPLRPGCGGHEIEAFFNRRAESVCGMCPVAPESFTLGDPLRPLKFVPRDRAPKAMPGATC